MVAIKVLVLLFALVALASAQNTYDAFFRGFRASGANNGPDSTGPVVFPQSPESPETSGVVVGASGYGFVPPGSQGVGRNLPRPTVKNFGNFF